MVFNKVIYKCFHGGSNNLYFDFLHYKFLTLGMSSVNTLWCLRTEHVPTQLQRALEF